MKYYWRNSMTNTTKINTDIDYENMDDLPLSGHFEWQYFQIEMVDVCPVDDQQDEWLAA